MTSQIMDAWYMKPVPTLMTGHHIAHLCERRHSLAPARLQVCFQDALYVRSYRVNGVNEKLLKAVPQT